MGDTCIIDLEDMLQDRRGIIINMWKLIPKTNSVLSDVDYEKELIGQFNFCREAW